MECLNYWNGKSNKPEVLIGGPQDRVDSMADVMKVETINKNSIENWPSDLKPYLSKDNVNQQALDFNQKWIDEVMKRSYRIYDAGRPSGYSPFYHGIEIPSTINYNNVFQTRSYFSNELIINYRF